MYQDQDSLQMTNCVELIGTIERIDALHKGLTGDSVIELRIERTTPGKSDLVKVAVQNKLLPYVEVGMKVYVKGLLYMYCHPHKSFASWKLRVMCTHLEIVEHDVQDMNYVSMCGKIAKLGKMRITPVSEKLIIDFQMQVYSWKDEKIPVIAWGRDARVIDTVYLNSPQQEIQIVGRLQERYFEKVFNNGNKVIENVYEVSARYIGLI